MWPLYIVPQTLSLKQQTQPQINEDQYLRFTQQNELDCKRKVRASVQKAPKLVLIPVYYECE